MNRNLLSITAMPALALALAATSASAVDWKAELGVHSGVDVRVQVIQDPFIDSLKEISPTFEGVTGAKVTIEGFGYDPLHEKQILSCSQNDGQYDVLFIDGIWVGEFVEAGCIDPVEDRVAATDPEIAAIDDYIESFAGQAYWEGKLQCLPIAGY